MLAVSSATALASVAGLPFTGFSHPETMRKLAINGGGPIREKPWPSWPVWDETAEPEMIKMLRSGHWWRGNGDYVEEFERKYAEMIGTKRCLGTASGTAALLVASHVLGVDAGDEVLVSPYTFIATYNVIFMNKALPVFVDTDPETLLLDPSKIESRITDRTTAIMPVHIYGLPVDMDPVNEIARRRGLKVIEDACQAWLTEYKGKKAGTLGDLGCFSFQNSKHIPTGEGGAITGNNDEIMDRCYAFHNCGREYGTFKWESPLPTRGSNRRMQQMQAIMLMSQMNRAQADFDKRLANARYLNQKLAEIPGIHPHKPVADDVKPSYHMYPVRFDNKVFNGASKDSIMKALRAEGIPCYEGYGPQNTYGLIEEALSSRGYKRLFPEARLRQYREENILPGNDQVCEQTVCFFQNMLLGEKQDMDDIVHAVTKLYENRDQLN